MNKKNIVCEHTVGKQIIVSYLEVQHKDMTKIFEMIKCDACNTIYRGELIDCIMT